MDQAYYASIGGKWTAAVHGLVGHLISLWEYSSCLLPPSFLRDSDAEGRGIRRIAKRNTIPRHELQYSSGPAVPAI